MCLKFCNHIKATLEIIQILVMTGFFGSPCNKKEEATRQHYFARRAISF